MTPQDVSRRSKLRWHSQTPMNRNSNIPDSGSSLIESSLQDSTFPDIHSESSKDVDAYKGALLGVEDELIDALNDVVYSSPTVNQQSPESPTSSQFYSWPTCRLPGAGEELIDALALLPTQVLDHSTSPQSSGLPAYCDLRSPSEFAGHKRRSIMCSATVSPTFWNPWAAGVYDDGSSSNSSEKDSRVRREASVAMASRGIEPVRTNCSTPITPYFRTHLPPANDSDPPEASATSIASDDLAVGLFVLERPMNVSPLGTWDLNDWQGTMCDLLLAGSEDDDSRESIVSN